jgi:hypothetical protein
MTDRVHLPLVQAIQALTSPDAKLMLLVEHRGFYIPRQHTIGTPLFQEGPFTPPEQFASVDSMIEVLKHKKITHVVAATVNRGPDQGPGWLERNQPLYRLLEQCMQQGRLVLLWESEECVLLKVAE